MSVSRGSIFAVERELVRIEEVDVSIVVPIYNEIENIPIFHGALMREVFGPAVGGSTGRKGSSYWFEVTEGAAG